MKQDQHYITLKDGRKLASYRPLPPKNPVSLYKHVPENTHFLEVEIGAGTGRFLANRAAKYPERFFIGIDKKKDRIDVSLEKLQRSEIKNWELLRCDARLFLEQELPPIDILHVYHPDPWPKKRHHKHRFFRSHDAKHWAQAIKTGGELRISTDQADYFEEIIAIVDSWNLFQPLISFVKRSGVPLSHFEEIFLRQALPVYKAQFIKK